MRALLGARRLRHAADQLPRRPRDRRLGLVERAQQGF